MLAMVHIFLQKSKKFIILILLFLQNKKFTKNAEPQSIYIFCDEINNSIWVFTFLCISNTKSQLFFRKSYIFHKLYNILKY